MYLNFVHHKKKKKKTFRQAYLIFIAVRAIWAQF